MKLLNKIIIAFFVLTLIILYGGWRFIHSEDFSRNISVKVSSLLTKKFGAKLSFTGVEFRLVPLSTTFKNVTIHRADPLTLDLDLNAEELSVAFTYSSFLSSNLEIDEVHLSRGSVEVKINDKSDDEFDVERLNPSEFFKKYQDLISKLPVRLNLITAKSIDTKIDQSRFFINSLSVTPHRRQIRAKAEIGSLYVVSEDSKSRPIRADSIRTRIMLDKEAWNIEELEVSKNANKAYLNARLINPKGYLLVDGKTKYSGKVEDLLNEIPGIPHEILPIKADVSAGAVISGKITDPELTVEFDAKNASTQWIVLDQVTGKVKKDKKIISLEKLSAKNNKEQYLLKQRHPIFNISTMKFTDFHLKLRLNEAEAGTFLHYVKDLSDLKFNITGDVDVLLDSHSATFNINDKVVVKKFNLLNSNKGSKPVLSSPGFELSKSKIVINSDETVDINANLLAKNTNLKATGKIGKGKIDVKVSESQIDLNSIGPISGIALKGVGQTHLHIHGPLDLTVFDFDVDWKNFSLLDLNFGHAKAKFSFSLADLKIMISELNGVYGSTQYNAQGSLEFKNNEGMDLKVNLTQATFKETRQMLGLIFNKIKLPIGPDFNFSSTITLKGGYEVEKLRVDGTIKGSDLKIGDEEADRLSTRLTLANNHLSFRQVKINKARGQLMANVSISLANNYIELNGAAQGMRLNDFNTYRRLNLEYDGDLFLDFDGNGTTDAFNSKFKLRLANAFIGNIPASASNALLYVTADDVVTNASLLGGKIKLDSLTKIKTGLTATKASVDTNDIREILGVFSGHNINEKGITGRVKADLNTQISLKGEGVRKFYLNVADLNLRKGNIDLSVDPRFNKIEVEEGIVKTWDLRFRDGNDFFTSKGKNISNGVIQLDQRFSIKANLLEMASEYVDRAVGTIKGTNSIVLEKNFEIKEFNLGGDNLSMKIRNLPGFLNDLQFSVQKKGEVYELSRLTGRYGEGDIRVSGRFILDDLYPQINLDYRIDRATIPLFKKSNVLISSTGTISGTDLPYRLVGKVFFLHGEFLDDPSDFTKDGKVSIDEYKKYLPQKDLNGKKAFLDMNIAFDITNPLVLKNNMAEVYFKGNGQATGDVLAPEFNTRLEIVPTVSKFKFKGHDFELNQGYVEIRDRGKNRLSDLKFTGVSKINEYEMKLDLSGNISKVNVDLSSEPALSKEDLLSLLTFGVTSDMSKNLEAGERKFVTTVGIGTLLVDQLKINEDLNSTLGLKLSVQPEFKENESALVQGKAAVTDSGTSRLKSATKIKINKQVTNKVDVSLSSTVGGSLEQKQEMNVNFNINKNLSVEGVYEMKPTTESENTNSPNSLGADLKYRWSF